MHSSELQLHAAPTTPKALHIIYWLCFPVNSDIQHGQQQLPIQPCILSPQWSVLDTCTFNIPSYVNWFNFYLLNEMHSYCLFEPRSCNCVTYRIIPWVPQCLPPSPSVLQNQFLPFEGQQFLDLTAAFEALLQSCVELKESLLALDVYSRDGASS